MGNETVEPNALTATTYTKPPEGPCKMALLISVDAQVFKGCVRLLDPKDTFKKHCIGKVPPYTLKNKRVLREGMRCNMKLFCSEMTGEM